MLHVATTASHVSQTCLDYDRDEMLYVRLRDCQCDLHFDPGRAYMRVKPNRVTRSVGSSVVGLPCLRCGGTQHGDEAMVLRLTVVHVHILHDFV